MILEVLWLSRILYNNSRRIDIGKGKTLSNIYGRRTINSGEAPTPLSMEIHYLINKIINIADSDRKV